MFGSERAREMSWLPQDIAGLTRNLADAVREIEDLRKEVGVIRKCLVQNGLFSSDDAPKQSSSAGDLGPQMRGNFSQADYRRQTSEPSTSAPSEGAQAVPAMAASRKAAVGAEGASFPDLLLDMISKPEAMRAVASWIGMDGLYRFHLVSKKEGRIFTSVASSLWTPKIFICGGQCGGDLLRTVDTIGLNTDGQGSKGSWETTLPMSVPRRSFAAASLSGCLYVCGGDDGYNRLNSVERFDPGLGCWASLDQPMMERRVGAAAASLRGKLYVCGGGDEKMKSAEVFDPLRGVWAVLPEMLTTRYSMPAATLRSCLYVVGGKAVGALNSAERFDPDLRKWASIPPMRQRRGGAAVAATRNSLIVCGGNDGGQDLSSAERFSVEADAWEEISPMLQRRWGACAVHFGDHVYVFGGSHDGNDLASVERISAPQKNNGRAPLFWEFSRPLRQKRSIAAAVMLRA